MYEEILTFVNARSGHFKYESGHHGDTWLDLETICSSPAALVPYITELSSRIGEYEPEVICGPLVEGALLALLVAADLRLKFVYAARYDPRKDNRLYSVEYRIPGPLREAVRRKRVAIVNDVISAGSAVRGAYEDLISLQADVVVVASLVTLGDEFVRFAGERKLPMVGLLHRPHNVWEPSRCPLCAGGMKLEQLAEA
jgi:orotate phosphoribosyltransferase